MNQILNRPYEISVWEDRLVDDKKYYEEVKIATIGSNTMTAPHRVYSPTLTKNVNGEITLSFQLTHRYYDEVLGKIVTNPIEKYLVNERKVKLNYDGEWYDFIIKNCDESSENVFSYELTSLFVNELSKVGYNTVLSNELQNNFGTIFELSEAVVKDTDWVIDRENSDIIQQFVAEPLYRFTLSDSVSASSIKRLDGGAPAGIAQNDTLLVFYSQIKNKKTNNFQFLKLSDKDESFTFDDNNVATGINYEFINDVTFVGEGPNFIVDGTTFTVDSKLPLNLEYQGYRLAYNQRTTYDTITERPVTIYRIPETDNSDENVIYKYTDYEYASSDVITNFVTNGSGFNIYSNGSLEGWTNATQSVPLGQDKGLQELSLTTYPTINQNQLLSNLSNYGKIEGFLRLQFHGVLDKSDPKCYKNYYYNDGIKDSADRIGSFSKGEKYVLRTRFGVSEEKDGQPMDYTYSENGMGGIRAIIAKYTLEEATTVTDGNTVVSYLHTIDPKEIYFDFNGTFTKKNSVISTGVFTTAEVEKDGVVGYPFYKDEQTGVISTPSLNTCYVDRRNPKKEYVWNSQKELYVENSTSDSFLDYYYTIAECQKPLSNTDLQDPTTKIGIFVYIDDESLVGQYVFVNDIQIFKYREDADKEPVLIGNIPKSTALQTDYYYEKPVEGTAAEDIETFSSLDAIADYLNVPVSEIKPYYNENYEKVSSIEASQSNIFNIIQDLCETFECWAKFNIAHDEMGKIKVDSEGAPVKTISFHKYSGKDNYSGFKYGINLNTVERTFDSNEYVSKLIVEPVELEVTEGGTLTIANASSNPSGENYILNFSYYLNQGLITNKEEFTKDLYQFYNDLKEVNDKYKVNSAEATLLALSLSKATARLNTYTSMVDEAATDITEAQNEFVDLVGTSYENYVTTNGLVLTINTDNGWNFTYPKGLGNLDVGFFSEQKEELDFEIEAGPKSSESQIDEIFNVEGTPRYIAINEVTGYTPNVEGNVDKTDVAFKDYSKGNVWDTDNLPTELIFSLTDDNETLIGIIGRIYTDYTVINQYSGLLAAAKIEHHELDEKLNGTKDHRITISTNGITNTTKIRVDDYIEGLNFTLEKTGESASTYYDKTSVLKKDFDYDKLYNKIEFTHYPTNYQLRYKVNGEEVKTPSAKSFVLTPDTTISFKLVPIEAKAGLVDAAKKLLEEKDEISNAFYKKYSRYIQEGSWTSDNYVDPELYYLDALQVSNTSAQPQVSYQMSVVEISELPGFENYYFDVGDKSYIEDPPLFGYKTESLIKVEVFEQVVLGKGGTTIQLDPRATGVKSISGNNIESLTYGFNHETKELIITDSLDSPIDLTVEFYYDYKTPVREEIIVSEVVWNLDDPTQNTITIQNYKTQFADLFQRIAATVQTVEYNQSSYSRAASMLDTSGLINSDLLAQSLENLGLGYNLGDGSNTLSENGFISKSKVLGKEANQLKIDDGKLSVSTDGGRTWNNIIDQTGLISNTINTQEIIIKDGENPSFRWDKAGLSAYTINDDGSYNLNKFVRFDDKGIYGILNETNPPKNSRTLDEVKEDASFGLTWDGFFLKNTYEDGGMVSISSENDIQVIDGNDQERIKIGKIDRVDDENQYGIVIKNSNGDSVFETADDGNITVTGTINATGGQFTDSVTVGNGDVRIIIQGGDTAENTVIQSSDFGNTSTSGWSIAATGDAIFNNITARGAIKTATFEYSEIQAVGGAFLFRPATTIREAEIKVASATEESVTYDTDLYLTVENGSQFKVGDWCKVSNFDPDPEGEIDLSNMGLANIYPISEIGGNQIVLEGAAEGMFPDLFASAVEIEEIQETTYVLENNQSPISEFDLDSNFSYNILHGEEKFISGSPMDVTYAIGNVEKKVLVLGNLYLYDNVSEDNGEDIAIVKDGDTVILYARPETSELTLSGTYYRLFNNDIEVLVGGALISFANYKQVDSVSNDVEWELSDNYGIGINSSGDYVKLPPRGISLFETTVKPNDTIKIEYDFKAILGTLPRNDSLGSLYNRYLQNTQGIFTNNMYIGNADQYLAFYTENEDKKLKIKASEILFEVAPNTYKDVSEIEGEDGIVVEITSSAGIVAIDGKISTILTCHVYQGTEDISAQVGTWVWSKDNVEIQGATSQTLELTNGDAGTYSCEVTFEGDNNNG